MTTLAITQGATRTIEIVNIVDRDGTPLDVTSWFVHAVARKDGVPGPVVAEWVTGTPAFGQGQATAVGPKVQLAIPPAMSSAWTWDLAALQVEITEPGANGRVERIVGQADQPIWLILDREAVL